MEPSILVQRVGDKNTPTQKRKKNNSADRRRTLHKEAQNSMDLAMSTHTTAVYWLLSGPRNIKTAAIEQAT